MERIAYYFDGFNFYHSLQSNVLKPRYKDFKWFDYNKLCNVLTPKSKTISGIYYFSAYREWKTDSYRRHKNYVNALKTTGVQPVLGKFKKVTRHCVICGATSDKYHEEKQTDVNIALYLLRGALLDEYDTAILCTADSDLIPAIKEVKKYSPLKKIGVLIPIGRKSFDLENEADFTMRIKEKHLKTCQLPNEIASTNIKKPPEW